MYNLTCMKNLIFDLDGTLWDATETNRKSFEDVGKEFFGPGYTLTLEQLKQEMGKTMDVIAKDITPEGIDEITMKKFAFTCFAKEVFNLAANPGKLYENELEVLEVLKKEYNLYIVSNCQKGYIDQYINIVPPNTFKSFLCFGDTNASKDITILELMKREHLKDAIYIGDTLGDEISAHKANIPFISACYGFGTCDKPEGVINSLIELKPVADLIYKEHFKK